MSDLRDRILSAVGAGPGRTSNEIVVEVGCRRNRTLAELAEMAVCGLLVRCEGPRRSSTWTAVPERWSGTHTDIFPDGETCVVCSDCERPIDGVVFVVAVGRLVLCAGCVPALVCAFPPAACEGCGREIVWRNIDGRATHRVCSAECRRRVRGRRSS